MDRLRRRITAAAVAAALLAASPGLPCYEAAAAVVTSGNASRAGSSVNAGTAGLTSGSSAMAPGAGIRPVLSLDFSMLGGLSAPSAAVPKVSLGLQVQAAPAALPAAPAMAAPVVLSAEKPAAEAPVMGRFQPVQAAVESVKLVQDADGISRTLSAPESSTEKVQTVSARAFDAALPRTEETAIQPVSSWRSLGQGISKAYSGLRKNLDLSETDKPEPEPPPPPPATPLGKTMAGARTGVALLLAAGLGIGFVFAGASVAASAALWSPLAAAIAGGLGLAALTAATKKRFAPAPAAKKKSLAPALLAGAGLFLGGAAAAPALAAVVGAAALHVGAVGLLVSLALLFEFLNGMHDAANSIATVVATKTLTPRQAVLWAAFFNSIAYFFFGAHIATTIGSGLISPAVMSNALLTAALLGASLWNWITVRLGIPVSSSHSLIGGLVGAALVAGGVGALVMKNLLSTALFMVVSPAIGLAAAFALMALIGRFFKGPLSDRAHKAFGGAQLASSALLSLGHGGNDSQKTIGIITALLFANGFLGAAFHVPWFVAVASYLAMGLGTMMGGWSIIRTLGEKVTKLDRSMGTAAEVGAGAAIMLSTWLGVPVSTTHVVTGSVTGVGAAHNGAKSVKWKTLAKIAWAWVLTIPFAALSSGLLYLLFTVLLRLA